MKIDTVFEKNTLLLTCPPLGDRWPAFQSKKMTLFHGTSQPKDALASPIS